jgi:hypothetical protein
MTRRFALAALHFVILAACGGSSPPPPTKVSSAALFVNPNYVQYDMADPTAEASDVRAALDAANIPVTEFVGTTAAEINAAVAGRTALVFPDQEVDTLALALDAPANDAIKAFATAGGTVVVVGSNQNGLDLVNGAFGFRLTTGTIGATEPFDLVAASAAGTPFAGGPTAITLPFAQEVNGIEEGSLPTGAKVLYEDASADSTTVPPTLAAAVVVEIPVGAGRLVVLGWSFHDSKPNGSQDGGWLQVFDTATRL